MNKASNNLHPLWSVHEGKDIIFATALHAGHEIRKEMAQIMALDELSRLREEDPYTELLAKVTQNRIVPLRSRFEVDLNRPREEAVYLTPGDAWGLHIWQQVPNQAMVERSLREFDQFYAETKKILQHLEQNYGCFVVFDLHSYNHRRGGPDAPPEDPATHPEVNVGTGTMERHKWANVVDRFIRDLRAYDYEGKHLDVRENVKFIGRQFATWVHSNFPETGCVLSIEFKKFFMDEWTGAVDPKKLRLLFAALKSTLPGISEELRRS